MKLFKLIWAMWKKLCEKGGTTISIVIMCLLGIRLYFAYKDVLSQNLLLVFDILTSVLALVFALEQILAMKEKSVVASVFAIVMTVIPIACIYGVAIGNDISGVSEYLGYYSAYLGVATCFLQACNQK